MSDLHLARPLVLLALLLLPIYGWLRARGWQSDAVPYAPLQYRRPKRRRRVLARLRLPLELLLLILAVTGLAGPYREREIELLEGDGIDVALVLDVSLSMLATDFPPSRLAALRRTAGDFISRAGGHRVGLLIFARDCFVQTPLTTDHAVLRELLDGVTVETIDQVKSGGTAIGDALLAATDHLERSRVEGRDQALILITDGESNMGIDPALAARYARQRDVRVYAIGIGGTEPIEVFHDGERVGGEDPYLAVLDETELRSIAAASEGRFFRATDAGALERVFTDLSRLESAPLESRRVAVRRPLGRPLALATLGLFAVSLALGGVVLRRPLR